MKILSRILISLLVVSIVSAVISWFFTYTGIPFRVTFAFFIILQFLGWYLYTDITTNVHNKQLKLTQERVESLLEANGTNATCSYCKDVTFIPIVFAKDNSYNCPHCGKENAVYITIETAQKTQFLENAKFNSESPDNEKPL